MSDPFDGVEGRAEHAELYEAEHDQASTDGPSDHAACWTGERDGCGEATAAEGDQ